MNVLIAEDEAPAARRLERLLREQLGEKLTGISVAATVDAARAALAASRIDLLLLDLNLNGADGFSILDAAPCPRTIVVSANSSRAIDAFDRAVIDFVTKPVSPERLAIALKRVADDSAASTSGRAMLAVRAAGRIELAAFADIVSLSGADDYVEVALADGRRFLHDTSLRDLELRLPSGFVRVHRSHIANTAHLRAIRTLPGRRRVLDLSGGASVPVSRNRLSKVMSLLPR
ncbi:MAG TPA: LytTR family DNA-binding domain-containing protein [Hyphomonadaceae bacterium]|jgi:DNA-binding LytR/AlgR family response regulator|nr:LytTR family DNA-binding domain-containing protein [Hyphomonadaceae bacterium]